MMTIQRGILLSVAVWVMMSGSAIAQQRPLVTEDPETVGVNRVLVEGGFELDYDQFYPASGMNGNTIHGPTFGVSVGVGPATEIQVDGGFQRLTITERTPTPLTHPLDFTGDHASTLEDFVIGTKIRLASESEGRPALGVRFGTKLPTAKAERAMGLGTTDFFATMLVAKTVQSVRTVGNVGFLFLGNPISGQTPAHALGYGLSVARALTNELEIVGELNGRTAAWGETVPIGLESRSALRFAGRYTYSLFRLDVGLLVGLTSRDPSVGLSFGATYVISR